MNRKYEMDMTSGPLLKKLIVYAVPLMLSGMLQLLFNAVDVIVVGKCVDETALAAVGSTGSLVNLLIGLFMGLSVGTNVLVARNFGAGRTRDVEEVNHTSICLGLIFGTLLAVIGFIFARIFLVWMGSPEDVIDQAALYLRIYFLGMPFNMVYNFAAATLRAVGDTKRPMYFLIIAGVVNLVLNLFFVVVLRIGVAGVAIATVASQALSCYLIIRCLLRTEGAVRLDIHKLKITRSKLPDILAIGLPAGLQGVLFSFSNVLIQSSINSFGSTAMAGNTAASNLEGFIYTAMNAFYQTCISFVSQNLGAKKLSNIWKVTGMCLILVSLTGILMGGGCYLAGNVLLRLYTDNTEAVSYGMTRLSYVARLYFLCGMMDTMVGALRGIGASLMPMIVSLMGSCVFRIVWIMTYFKAHRSLGNLFMSYPLSWAITAGIHIICFLILFKKVQDRLNLHSTAS